MNIAVTGGMGSGKSFVAGALAEMIAARKISADRICREQLKVGQLGFKLLQKHLPEEYFLRNATLDRPFLRKAIFSNDALRRKLDELLHPLVRQEILLRLRQEESEEYNFVVEVPLLFEKNWQSDFDLTLVVYADDEVCVNRIIARDGVSPDEARAGIDSQMSLDEKRKLSRWCIDNSGDYDASLRQLGAFVLEVFGTCSHEWKK